VGEKLARERTCHRSNALFAYQKPCKRQLENVSAVLSPVIDTIRNSCGKESDSAPQVGVSTHTNVQNLAAQIDNNDSEDVQQFEVSTDLKSAN
jgi:hypothetical protein